ncbi:MAG: hypothetical protein QXO27_04615 [Candidatus Aenigmatarchaeota archaeon]
MKKILLLSIIAVTLILSASTVTARQLPTIGIAERTMFKNMVQSYLHPEITGWGIGLNTEEDSYLVAKFHAVTVKTLPRTQILQIIKDAKAGNVTDWSEVRDRIKAAIDANGTTLVKGRIQINKEVYILTGIVKTETTFSGIIRIKPNYTACVTANISTEDCENQSAQIGDLSLTRKTAEFEVGKDRVWAGTMNFNNTAYTFVALVNPRVR